MEDATHSFVNAIPLSVFNTFWRWADAGFGTAVNVADCQRRLWQSWFDLQLTLLQQAQTGTGRHDPVS